MAKSPAEIKFHPRIGELISDIAERINHQTGNTTTSETVLQKIFADIFYIQDWPWIGTIVKKMEKNWRQHRVGNNYILYYFVTNDGTKIYALNLRHVSQKPLQPSTLKRYKKEIPD